MASIEYGLGMGALFASIHILRTMVNRGLVSPDEVEEIYSSMMQGLQEGNAQFAAMIESKIEGQFAEFRRAAKDWIGKDQPSPE